MHRSLAEITVVAHESQQKQKREKRKKCGGRCALSPSLPLLFKQKQKKNVRQRSKERSSRQPHHYRTSVPYRAAKTTAHTTKYMQEQQHLLRWRTRKAYDRWKSKKKEKHCIKCLYSFQVVMRRLNTASLTLLHFAHAQQAHKRFSLHDNFF